jgi:hypothetical protein
MQGPIVGSWGSLTGNQWASNGLPPSGLSQCGRLGEEGRTYRNILETHANDEVARPVAETSHSHCCRPGSLAEELGHDEPWDGAGANLKECHKAKNGHNGDIAHGWNPLLREGGKFGSSLLDLPCPLAQERTEIYNLPLLAACGGPYCPGLKWTRENYFFLFSVLGIEP